MLYLCVASMARYYAMSIECDLFGRLEDHVLQGDVNGLEPLDPVGSRLRSMSVRLEHGNRCTGRRSSRRAS